METKTISEVKPEPYFKGYNKGSFSEGNPTQDVIGENCPRTVYERVKPTIAIYYPYEPFKAKKEELFFGLKKYMETINWGLPIVIPSKKMNVTARNELSMFLRQFDDLVVRYYNDHSGENKTISYLICFESGNEEQTKAISKFMRDYEQYLRDTNQKPFKNRRKQNVR